MWGFIRQKAGMEPSKERRRFVITADDADPGGDEATTPPIKRGRGRPKGSKNRPVSREERREREERRFLRELRKQDPGKYERVMLERLGVRGEMTLGEFVAAKQRLEKILGSELLVEGIPGSHDDWPGVAKEWLKYLQVLNGKPPGANP